MKKTSHIKPLLSLFAMIILLNACVEQTDIEKRSPTSNGGGSGIVSLQPSKENGETLYSLHCATCHQGLPDSTIHSKSVAEIENALVNVDEMQKLQGKLHDEDIKKIADALSKDVSDVTGVLLYNNNCASCHGSIETSDKLDASSQAITAAISAYSAMHHLSFLDKDSIKKIADALSLKNSTKVIETKEPSVKDRVLLFRKMTSAFEITTNASTNTSTVNLLKSSILSNPTIFSGPCPRYSNDCNNSVVDNTALVNGNAEVIARPNTVRRGTLIKSCTDIARNKNLTDLWLIENNFDFIATPTGNDIDRFIQIFFPSFYPATSLKNAFLNDIQDLKDQNTELPVIWQSVIFGFCSSPLMEIR